MIYKLAYIDEDPDDRETYKAYLEDSKLEIVAIDPFPDIETFVEYIISEKLDGVIVDYTLFAKRPDIKYSGVELVKALWSKREDYPAFILTNNRDNDNVDDKIKSTQVFLKKQVSAGGETTEEIKRQLVKEIGYYISTNQEKEEELQRLFDRMNDPDSPDLTDGELQKLHDLDDQIYRRLNRDKRFTDIIKNSDNMKSLSNLLNEAEDFLKKMNSDGEQGS